MVVTKIKLLPIDGVNGYKAITKIELDNQLILTGLKLLQIDGKYRLIYPKNEGNKSNSNVKYVNPITKEFSNYLLEEVVKEYERKTNT